MVSRFLIYGLVDPRSGDVRYIGKSTSGMKRPKYHARPQHVAKAPHTHKNRWLQKLLNEGLRPGLRVLEEFEAAADIADGECFWIAQGKGLDWPLTNLAKGGVGPLGHVVTPEVRARISAALTGRKMPAEHGARVGAFFRGKALSAEHRAKLSAVQKGRSPTPERVARQRASLTGFKQSAETRARMCAGQRKRRAAEREQ